MKKIITAIGDPKLNNELMKVPNVEMVNKDMQYKEGIIELLEQTQDVDIIIISEVIPGSINLIETIEKIQIINNQIEIIIILEEENEIFKNKLYEYGVRNIFYNNKTNIIEIINLINDKKIEREIELKHEIEKLRRMIEETPQEQGNIIAIVGIENSGKSIFTGLLAQICQVTTNKILILDFDIYNNNMQTIFGIKNTNKKMRNNKIKINKKIDLISIDDKINYEKDIKMFIENIIEENKNKYNLIIIDTTSSVKFQYNKIIMNKSDKLLLLIEPNLLEIKKSKKLLNILLNDWEINIKKINIILNKINTYSIEENIIKNIFYNIKIIGKLKSIDKYTLIINKGLRNISLDKIIKSEYIKISNKIFKKKGNV